VRCGIMLAFVIEVSGFMASIGLGFAWSRRRGFFYMWGKCECFLFFGTNVVRGCMA
jgi:hypothetical protein